ncbi:uncharacterized protein [Panulirus ornatus]|uniref:uncharacterized protein isoform X2 n=1 Tax=Panulirus ornatus TaxID=150431 RepID=UPI003A85013A
MSRKADTRSNMKTIQVLRNAASTSFFGSMKLIWVAVCAAVVVGVPAAASPLGQLGVAAALSAAVPRDLNGSWGEQIAQGERRVGAATPDDGEWVWTSSGGSPGGQASTAVSQSRSLFTSLIAPFVGGRQRPRGGHRGREKPRPQIWRPAFTLHPPRPRPPQPTSHHPAGVPPQLLQSGLRDGQPHVFSAIHAPDITSADFPGYPETSLTVGDADSASPVTIDLSEFSEPRPEDVVYIEYEDGGDGANFQQNSGSFIQVSTPDQPNEPVSGFQPPREYSVHGNAVSAHSSTENVKLSEVFSPPSFNVEEKFSKPFATISGTENSLNLQNDNVYVTADTSLHDDSHGAQDPPAPHHHHQATQPSTSPPPRSSPLRQQFNHLQIIPSQPDHQTVPLLPSYLQPKQQPLSSPSQPKQQTLASPSQLKQQTLPSSPEQHTLSSLSLDSLPKQQKPSLPSLPKQQTLSSPSQPKQQTLSSPSLPKQQTLSSPSQPKQQTLSSPSQPKQQTPSASLHLQPKQQTSSSSQPKQQTPSSSSSSQPKQQTPSSSSSSQPKQQTPSSSSQPKQQTPPSQPKQQTPPSQPKQQTLSTPSHPSQPTEIQPLSSRPRTTPPAPQQQEPPRSWVKETRVTLTSSPSSHPEGISQDDFVTSPAKRQVPGPGHRLPQTPGHGQRLPQTPGHGHRLSQTPSNGHSSPQTPTVPARMREASSSSQEHLSSVGSFAPLPAFTQDELGSPAATTAGFLPFEDSSEFFDHVFEGRSPFGEKVQTEKPGSPSRPTSRPFRRSTQPLASTPTLHSLSYTESLSATLTPSSQTSSFSSINPPFQPPEPSSHTSTGSSLSEEVFPASVNDLPLETTKSPSSIPPWTTLTGPLAREQDRIEEEGTAVAGQFSPVGKGGHNTRLATPKPTTAHTRPGRNSGDAPVTPSGIPSLSTREAVSLGVREKPRPVTTSSAENADFDVLVLPYEAVDGNYDVDQTTTISTTHQPVQYSQTTKPEEVDVFLVRRTRPSLGWLNIPTPRPDLPPHPQPQHNTITTRIQAPPSTSSHVSRPETTRVREPLVSVGPASEDGGRPVHEHPQHHQQQQQHQEFPNIFGLKRPQPGGRDLPLDQDDHLKRPLNHDGQTSDLTLGHDDHTSDLTLDHDDHTSDLTLGHDDHTSDLTLRHDDHTSDLTLGHDDHDFKQSLSHDHSLDLPVDNVDHSFERPVDQAGHNLTLPSHNHQVRETTAAEDGLPAEGVRSRDNGGPSHSSLVSSKEPGGFPQVLGSLTPPSSTTCDHGFCHDFANDQDK